MHKFYEFFAGGGMARAGLGPSWSCVFTNDFDPKKTAIYANNWGSNGLVTGDVAKVDPATLPGTADLAWASFPCQDLSLAGAGAGLKGERSGTFWPFWKLMRKLKDDSRAPRLIVLENVCGALTSHGGRDFAAIGDVLSDAGYKFGAVVIDAVDFVPQSRPRLFIIATSGDLPPALTSKTPSEKWHPAALQTAQMLLKPSARKQWVWWQLPMPAKRNTSFLDLIEAEPKGMKWHTPEQTAKLVGMMSMLNLEKLRLAQLTGRRMVGGVYKRTRPNEFGKKVQRAEVRFDDISGCLRTPVGGSSRQTIILVEGSRVKSRLLSAREAVRLMGLSEEYKLPENYNEAYHLAGDGVVVPVVRFLAENLLEPLLGTGRKKSKKAA